MVEMLKWAIITALFAGVGAYIGEKLSDFIAWILWRK